MQPSASTPSIDRLHSLAKAAAHAHLEGCFQRVVLEQLAAQAGVPMPRPRDQLLQFEGLADFLHFLDWACGWASTRDRLSELIDAIDAGFAAAEQDDLPPVGLCVSHLRSQSADAAAELVDSLVALRHPRVVALSIDASFANADVKSGLIQALSRW